MKTALLASLAVGAALSAAPAVSSGLPWIENDYPQALSAARMKGVPMFVEAWAPW
jgi:hypothetical protein